MNNPDALHARAKALCLHGQLAHWHDATAAGWLHTLIEWKEQERARRSLERHLKDAHIGRFKPLCDFDWKRPKRCDHAAIEALMSLEFLNDASNVILVGPTATCLSDTDAWGNALIKIMPQRIIKTLLIKLAHSELIRARNQFGLRTLMT